MVDPDTEVARILLASLATAYAGGIPRKINSSLLKKILNQKYKSPYGKTFRDYRNQLELEDEQIELIIRFCKKLNIFIVIVIFIL